MVQSEFEMIGFAFRDFFLWVRYKLLSALNLASETNLAFLCLASSGEYFLSNLNKTFAKL